VLRAAVAMGLLNYNSDDQTFLTTSKLQVLHKDALESLKYFAQGLGNAFWRPVEYMPEAVALGSNQAVETLGSSVFEYFGQHPEDAGVFTAAMADISAPVIREAVTLIDISDARFALDVGGASGAFVTELVQRNPQLVGAVLDLPHVIAAVAEQAQQKGLIQRVRGIGGDFFEQVPAADIYLLKFILHDWDDRSCTALLDNIRRAMNPAARLFIVEMVVAHTAPSLDVALMDLVMLCSLNGKERDISEFQALLAQAGLRMVDMQALRGSYHLIEAVIDSSGASSQSQLMDRR
jgi:hypothetical protein